MIVIERNHNNGGKRRLICSRAVQSYAIEDQKIVITSRMNDGRDVTVTLDASEVLALAHASKPLRRAA